MVSKFFISVSKQTQEHSKKLTESHGQTNEVLTSNKHLKDLNETINETLISTEQTKSKYINNLLDVRAVWKEINTLGDKVSLYSEDYDVERVRVALRTAKLLSVWKLSENTALKWIMELEGNQVVLFKPRIQSRKFEADTSGICGCEYPEYEVAAFAINRMLKLRNMPFVTGRRFNWFSDILPVADEATKSSFNITEDGDVCVTYGCACFDATPSRYCFPQGQMTGSIMIWLDTPIETNYPGDDNGAPWTLYYPALHPQYRKKFLPYLPGDDTYCKRFRSTRDYNRDNRFVNILDTAVMDYLMLSYDSKDNYIINEKKQKVNVMIDRGKAFRNRDDVLLLAPVYQCCKIRKKVYYSLVSLQGKFAAVFDNETRTDILYPFLDQVELNGIESRLLLILKFIELCGNKFGLNKVLINT